MKTKSRINGHIIRGVVYAVFLAVAFIAASSAFDSPNKWYKSAVATVGYGSAMKSPSQPRAFSFAERVTFQRAIEDVYWRHRIWPKENPDRKPSLDAVMSQGELESKVRGYLRDSLALEDYWQRPITAQQLQAEMERMARDTKQPEVLRELFEALGNDPAVIVECLVRPILAERLIADLSVQGQTRWLERPRAGLRTISVVTTLAQVIYTLPRIADAGDSPCTDDTWTATSTTNAPSGRVHHTAVWTGSEMIVWGGNWYNTGGRYYPSTDSWAATSTTNAPSDRAYHTAVWTGSAMIVWGGDSGYPANTGGRYRPSTNTWTRTSTTSAPEQRAYHTAVWTGSEMIVWGGADWDNWGNYYCLYTGGRYNPSTNSWIPFSTTNAPSDRAYHTAVWTGSEMIVRGGFDGGGNVLHTGGRYNPSTNSWTATSTINAPYTGDTAVWTGSEMIVWGGSSYILLNTGGRYNPDTDGWTATSTANAPSARSSHTAVWTGSEMIVWGGTAGGNTGGRYNPNIDSWAATSISNAPAARGAHTAMWTGSDMIVWGGWGDGYVYLNTGGRYCAESGPTPTPTPTVTPMATPTPTATPTPCTGRCAPTPRPRPSPAPRP